MLQHPVVHPSREVPARANERVVHITQNLAKDPPSASFMVQLCKRRLFTEVQKDVRSHFSVSQIVEDQTVQGLVSALRVAQVLQNCEVCAQSFQQDVLESVFGSGPGETHALQPINDHCARWQRKLWQPHVPQQVDQIGTVLKESKRCLLALISRCTPNTSETTQEPIEHPTRSRNHGVVLYFKNEQRCWSLQDQSTEFLNAQRIICEDAIDESLASKNLGKTHQRVYPTRKVLAVDRRQRFLQSSVVFQKPLLANRLEAPLPWPVAFHLHPCRKTLAVPEPAAEHAQVSEKDRQRKGKAPKHT
mmetsp:Transcript_30879/g.81969  ORF Transcript_30879/g.81969 Transcript_30879/m.81969 type:complete len:304 (-) Transcript_30879:268-1179(-)